MKFLIFIIAIVIALIVISVLIDAQKSKKRFAEFKVSDRLFDTVDMLYIIVDELDDEKLKQEINEKVDSLRPQCQELAKLKQSGVENYIEEKIGKNSEGEEIYLPLEVKTNLTSDQETQAKEYIKKYNHILDTLKQCMTDTEKADQ